MITLFSTPKPFLGHIGMIQRNALQSWKLLHPDVEIILFGDDEGTAEICAELGLRHAPQVERTPLGTKRLNSIFPRAQEIARHDVLCYANCDIVFTSDFAAALERVAGTLENFLMVGRRWDLDVSKPIDFSAVDWAANLVAQAQSEGFQRLYYNIDYFAFRRGLYENVPPLGIGRLWWDQWLVWQASEKGVPVVDVSDEVCAVHQNHDYSYHPQGLSGVWHDEASQQNFQMAGRWGHLHTIEDATLRLAPQGFVRNRSYWLAPAKRRVRRVNHSVRTFVRTRIWHPSLDATRNLRHRIGLRKEVIPAILKKNRVRRHWLDQ